MPSSSPPPQHGSAGRRWWLKPWLVPGRVWRFAKDAADLILDVFKRRPSRWVVLLMRLLVVAVSLVMAPFILVKRLLWPARPRASIALEKRVHELWRTSPFEAIDLLRSTVETLRASGNPFPNPLRNVEVPPFGKFDGPEAYGVHKFLFRCEFALGRYEEALEVCRSLPAQIPETILEQVDCLMAMSRRADAVALLEKNLNLDNWRGPLRRRLEELSGKPGTGVN